MNGNLNIILVLVFIVVLVGAFVVSKSFSDKKEEEKDNDISLSFVLLNDEKWSKEKLIKDVKDDWNLNIKDSLDDDDKLYINVDDMKVIVGFMDSRIPNNEAETYAETNYLWKDAVEVVKKHKAHIVVSVMGGKDIKERETLLAKISTSCLKQENANSLYLDGAVYEPEFYIEQSEVINEGTFPIHNLIWFGLYNDGEQSGFYTYGLHRFGYKEMEIYAKDADTDEIYMLITQFAAYVIDNDVELHDGETIGFSEEQKLLITESKGIAVDGNTLKIAVD